jgi:hypothetical protein
MPKLVCALCGKPIRDPASAISDAAGEAAFHFDCALTRVKERETLAAGEVLSYIGGGRFGIIRVDYLTKRFTIEKIIDWDKREDRLPWRKVIAEHYSKT